MHEVITMAKLLLVTPAKLHAACQVLSPIYNDSGKT